MNLSGSRMAFAMTSPGERMNGERAIKLCMCTRSSVNLVMSHISVTRKSGLRKQSTGIYNASIFWERNSLRAENFVARQDGSGRRLTKVGLARKKNLPSYGPGRRENENIDRNRLFPQTGRGKVAGGQCFAIFAKHGFLIVAALIEGLVWFVIWLAILDVVFPSKACHD